MKNRFALWTALALGFSMIVSVSAMAGAQGQEPGTDEAAKASGIMNLSPQQQSQLTPILQTQKPKIDAVKNDPSLSADDKKKKIKGIQEQTDHLVKPILTPIQYKQWQQIQKNERDSIK